MSALAGDQYRQLRTSAPAGAVISIRSTAASTMPFLARFPSIDVDAEHLLSARCVTDLKAGLASGVGGDEHVVRDLVRAVCYT